jgi:hypothetical protein
LLKAPTDEKAGNAEGAMADDDAFEGGELCLKMLFEISNVGCDLDTACATLPTEAGDL